MRQIIAFGIIAGALLSGFMTAEAQQPATPADKVTMTIAAELGRLRIDNVSLGVNIEILQGELARAIARIKELEDKYEPKKAPDTKP